MINYQLIKSKFESQKIYTYSEVLNLICKGQSNTASYILQDLLASGMVVKTINGYRINQ